MGCFVSCFQVVDDDQDEQQSPRSNTFGHRGCLQYLTRPQQLFGMLFQRGEFHVSSSSIQGTTSASAAVAEDSTVLDSYRAPPRPLPYDDPRCSRSSCQSEGLVSRANKASMHCHEDSELPGGRGTDAEDAGTAHKLHSSDNEGRYKSCLSRPSVKFPSKGGTFGVMYIFPSSEDEDVCPTCLEEYTSENPRIIMKCSHHFHLGCIYEWMERSEACPVCGKVMVFSETN